MDSTIETYSPANKTQFRFSIEAFKFIGMHDQVRTGLCGEMSLWSSICEVHQRKMLTGTGSLKAKQ